jgi:hypothetical protein
MVRKIGLARTFRNSLLQTRFARILRHHPSSTRPEHDMPLTTDTTHTKPVIEATIEVSRALFPGSSEDFIHEIFLETEKLFTGGYLDYQANDLRYHDFQHTLQVTVAYVDLFDARQRSGETPLTHRQFELGLTAALLHDSGYLKLRSDRDGTGAKYTFCHVLRSCAMAASILPSLNLKLAEIDMVLGAIRSTGPSTAGMQLRFNRHDDHVIASMVASADYLGQMAAGDYPDELELLFNEFAESDAFLGLPTSKRFFKSAHQLIEGSRAFWEQVVKAKLDHDFLGVYRFLTRPDGSHPYLDAIEHNLEIIARRQTLASL